jgi:hypothetical protein
MDQDAGHDKIRGAEDAQHRASKGRVETRKNDLFVSYC